MSKLTDLRFVRKDTNILEVEVLDSKTKLPVDLTSGGARLSIFSDLEAPFTSRVIDKEITSTPTANGEITDPLNGLMVFFLAPADTATLDTERKGSYYYGIMAKTNTGDLFTVAEGIVVFQIEKVETF